MNSMILVFVSERNFPVGDAQRSFTDLRTGCEAAGMTFGNREPPVFHAPSQQWYRDGADLNSAIPAWIQQCGGQLAAKTKSGPKMIIIYLSQKPCIECEFTSSLPGYPER